MQKRRENQIRGISDTTFALEVYHKLTKKPKQSVIVCGFSAVPSILVGLSNLLQKNVSSISSVVCLFSHPVILYYSAFNEGGNTTTGYGAVNISRTLQLSLPIAE
jgi:hypothetical protein